MPGAVKAFLAALWLLVAAAAAAHPPSGLVADREGNLYFSDLTAVWRVDPEGRLTLFRPAVAGSHVHELALAEDGAVEGEQNRYDPATQRFFAGLWRRTPDGEESWPVPMTEAPPNGMGLARDRGGNRYTLQWPAYDRPNAVLLRLRPDGRSEMLFEEEKGAGGGLRQTGLGSSGPVLVEPDGGILFANRGVLRRRAADGPVESIYDGGAGSNLRSLALARDGAIVAADIGRRAVISIRGDGPASTLYRPPEGWIPTGVAFSRGILHLLEVREERGRPLRVRVVAVEESGPRVVAEPGEPVERQGAEARRRPLVAAAGVAALVALALWLRRRAA